MKKFYYLPMIAVAFGGIVFNLHLNTNQKSKSTSVTISNISAVEASAGEAYCNPVNQNVCTITAPDGTKGTGVGNYTYID
jgi:hypothetical protein